jgi:hypothetical protein
VAAVIPPADPGALHTAPGPACPFPRRHRAAPTTGDRQEDGTPNEARRRLDERGRRCGPAALRLWRRRGRQQDRVQPEPERRLADGDDAERPGTTAPAAAGAPAFDFPSDLKVVVDPDTTGNAAKDAVLRDQAYGQKAIFLAIAKLDPKLPQLNKYLSGEALGNWVNSVKWGQSHHKSVTGSEHFYQRTVTLTSASSANVTFCENSRDAFDKDTATGKRINGTPSSKDFTLHLSLMRKGSDGVWTMSTYASQPGAAKCRP